MRGLFVFGLLFEEKCDESECKWKSKSKWSWSCLSVHSIGNTIE